MVDFLSLSVCLVLTVLYPFNPERVLRDIQKPLAELTVPKVDVMKVESCPQDKVPETPVSAEALRSLHNLTEWDTHGLDEASRQRLCLDNLCLELAQLLKWEEIC
jgi:hypothetical protein